MIAVRRPLWRCLAVATGAIMMGNPLKVWHTPHTAEYHPLLLLLA